MRQLMFTLILLISYQLIWSQSKKMQFSQVKGANGISLGKINSMTMDKHGFMWFSDQSNRSIIRYDGMQMKRYKNDPKDLNSLGGIPASIKKKIFQPFFTTKPTGQGTGLGLSLSYDIVNAHGGEIKVDSSQDKGTTFTISLPIPVN